MEFRDRDAGHAARAVIVHGFTRNGGHLESLADALFAAGIGSVRPDLGSFNWFRSVNNASLDRVADRLAATSPGPSVVIGHSTGGAAAAHLATRLPMVQGIVFVDATDAVHSSGGLARMTLPDASSRQWVIATLKGMSERCIGSCAVMSRPARLAHLSRNSSSRRRGDF